MALSDLSIKEMRQGLQERQFSAVELVTAFNQAIAKAETLNAYVEHDPQRVLAMAKLSDERIARGEARPLEGIPVAIKDMFCTRGIRTTACSKILDNFIPPYESTVTENLLNNGALFLGKTNCDEFAMGSSNETSRFGSVINPWRRTDDNAQLVPGGSSGGSATAVAAGICAGALGTDTGGSIRQPASFTGSVGMKPTYGRCSRWGIVAFASSLDQAGVFSRTVYDCALMMRAIAGYDHKDSTSVNIDVPEYDKSVGQSIKGLKIGIPRQYRIDGLDKDIARVWDEGRQWLLDAGAEVIEIDLPHTHYALPTYYIIMPAEASSNLARYDGVRYGLRVDGDNIDDIYLKTRTAGFGDEVKRRIFIGTYVLSAGYYDAYYVKAQKIRTLIRQDFTDAFTRVDAILTPTTPNCAFAPGDILDNVSMYLNDVFTVTANMAGIPGLSVPAAFDGKGRPIGLQILTAPFAEQTAFKVGSVIEAAASLDLKPEPWWDKGG